MPSQLKNDFVFRSVELRAVWTDNCKKPSAHKPVIKLSKSVTAISVNAINRDRSKWLYEAVECEDLANNLTTISLIVSTDFKLDNLFASICHII